MKRFPVISRVISCLSLAMFGLPCAASSLPSSELMVVASENDRREYRYLQLDNKLQVLLISDPSAEKSAAALDINVGSNQNPKDREGLAHFLEHMLFLGTEKYPEPGEYQEFISEHGGNHNAYTSSEHTNYFFDVDARHFEESLDRFAQFFVAPLFSEEYVDRERHAVESEYKLRIKNESRRRLDVYSEIVNPEHPLSMFRTGSLITLSDRNSPGTETAETLDAQGGKTPEEPLNDSVRNALIAFYERYYSANLMSLVVLGSESLDELEAMTAYRFAKIPNSDAVVSDAVIPLYPADFLPARVNIEPLKEERRLSLSFPIPTAKDFYRQKPLQYIGNLLGHEGEGSLLSFLKKYGWAEGLSAGGGDQTRFDGSFDINILLTERGVKAVDQIVALAFHVIQNLERKGIKEWRFDEDKALADIAFRFQEKGAAMETVSALANRLHTYAPEDVLRGAYLYEDFDPDVIRQFLSYLTPNNVLVTLTAPNLETDKVSRWYQTPYKVLSMEASAPFIVDKYSRQLFFPKANLFIPQRLSVKSTSLLNGKAANDAPPEKIIDVEGYEVWFKQDGTFDVPKASINLRLKLPMAAQSAKTAAMNKLFVALVNDSLTEFTYPASLAGLHFSITSNSRGMDIIAEGYNDRQGLLLTRIVETIRKARFDSARFESVKAELIRGWSNANKASPYQQLAREVAITAFSPLWKPLELRAALEAVSLADFNEFNAAFLMNAQAEALFYGNLYRQEAMKLAALVQNQLLHKEGDISLPRAQVVKLEMAEEDGDTRSFLQQLPVDHKDTAAILYVQGLDDTIRDKAKMLLLRQLFHTPFFNSLRTEKQLGYVVMASGMPLKKVPGTIMIVQSPSASGAQLIEEIGGFVESFDKIIPKDLTAHKQALSNNLLQAPKSLSQQSSRYWDNILYKVPAFDRRKRLVDAINAITREEFVSYYNAVTSSERRLWFISKKLDNEQLKDVKMVENPADFKRDAVVYSYQ